MTSNNRRLSQFSTKENHSTVQVILYYTLLGVIQALWTNQAAFPPLVLRTGMIILVFGPLLLKREYIPFVYIFFITLRLNLSTAYSYLPDVHSTSIYLLILIALSFVHRGVWSKFRFGNHGVRILAFSILLWAIVDLLNNGEIGSGASYFFLAFLLLPFLQDRKSFELSICSYIIVNLLLAIYYYVMFNKFTAAWGAEGLERSGWSDPNYFAIHLGIGFMMSMSCLFGFVKTVYIRLSKFLLIISAFSIFFAIMMTGSRAGLISTIIISSLLIFFSKNKAKYKLLPVLIFPIILYIVFTSQFAQLILYRLFEEESFSTAGDRVGIWETVFLHFDTQNFGYILFGGGWFHRTVLTNGADTHNELLAVLCDYGIIGVVTSIILYVSIIVDKAYKGNGMRPYLPFLYLLLMIVSLSPSQYPVMPMFLAWLMMSYILYEGKMVGN